MSYLRCAAVVTIVQLVWTGNTDAAIVKDGFASNFLARWSASVPWTNGVFPYAGTLARAFVDDLPNIEGEYWAFLNARVNGLGIHTLLSPELTSAQRQNHVVDAFGGVAYTFQDVSENNVRLQFASDAFMETVGAESTTSYGWMDDGGRFDCDVHVAACGPFSNCPWNETEAVTAAPAWIDGPLFAYHDHAISERSALALRLLAWLVVLMSVGAQSYNGWPNYATWYVFVWANACACEYWQDRVAAICKSEQTASLRVRNERIRTRLVRELAEWVQEKNPLRENASLYGDLLRGVIGEVDWMRIADTWMAELEESRRRRPLTEPALRA